MQKSNEKANKKASACETCGERIQRVEGKKSTHNRYCSNACRQRAYRRRVKDGTPLAGANDATQLSSFIGREHDLVELRRILRTTRLLTVTGPPGVGKSRLATELAKKEQRVGHRNTVFIDLRTPEMAGSDPRRAVAALEAAIEDQIAPTIRRTACRADEQRVLLDNCEHVLETSGAAIVDLLFRFPGLRVIATSREPWRISGEAVYRLPGLSLPGAASVESPESYLRADAVRLFVERSSAVNHEFRLNEENSEDVRAVCTALDGIPLALELAAQLARALPVAEIRERLKEPLSLLNQGWRTADPRHRSWRAALRWSYDHLSADEQRLFRRLSLLPGINSVEAATVAYGGDPADAETVPDLLISLEAKSLVVVRTRGPHRPSGYQVPNSVGSLGRHHLTASGEEEGVLNRLADWTAARARTLNDELVLSPGAVYQLSDERDIIRRLLSWLATTDDERQLSLSWALAAAELASGENVGDVLERIQHTLAVTETSSARRHHALAGALTLACWYGHGRQAMNLVGKTVAVARRSGDDVQLARAALLSSLANEMYGDREAAYRDLDVALGVARRGAEEVPLAVCRAHLARHLLHRGRCGLAAVLLEKTLPVLRASAPPEHLSAALITAGALALENDDLPKAEGFFQEALDSAFRPGAYDGILGLALCAARSHDFERVLKLMTTTEGRPSTVLRFFPAWRKELVEAYGAATRILSKGRVVAALASARGLGLRQSVVLTRADAVPSPPTGDDDLLTAREWEVLQLVMEGLANSEIAHRMHLSVRTVETHIRNIRSVLQLRSRAHMAAWAARHHPELVRRRQQDRPPGIAV
ncbi:LuxR C-terminal-related transcriptional regulator [Streptomyces sp. Edi2]|uniref:ATP-binding protein n=1 Tax=Streptomyces sp. Edi2 TaxID=3162528 RepID=UPI0033058A9B